ncbi:YerC/YecD family TrpR-related protein [Proteinivorax tanatarense]|uniref:YerC/YecD family TrpR-related protein n=1 Tax=Proteinivorax tanatarense TaxID=1260629 RepID=A0AAU7VP23_9FIRM
MHLDKLGKKHITQLFTAMLKLEDVDECYSFFEDLCTVNEVKSLAQRFEVAKMLKKGYTYNKIEEATGASTATISRVKRCLDYGEGGYNLIIDRLEKEE